MKFYYLFLLFIFFVNAQTQKQVQTIAGSLIDLGILKGDRVAIISENRLTAIPKNFDMRIAPLFGCAVTTAFGVVNNDARIKVGQAVVIFGIGGVGLNIAQAASMVSAYPIVGVDLQEKKL